MAADNSSNSNGAGGFAFRSARRRAIRQSFQPVRVKHGVEHAPAIRHTQDGTGTKPPKFGSGGGYKSGGY